MDKFRFLKWEVSRFKEAISSNSVNELLAAVDVLRDNNFITDDE